LNVYKDNTRFKNEAGVIVVARTGVEPSVSAKGGYESCAPIMKRA